MSWLEKISIRKCLGLVAAIVLLLIQCGCERTLAPPLQAKEKNVDALLTSLESAAGGGSAATATLAEPTGFADVTGTFRISGSAPPRQPLPVSGSDAAICAPGGKPPLDQIVVVGSDNGLANVLIYLNTEIPDNDKWIDPSTYSAKRDIIQDFDQKNCTFLDHVFAVWTTQKMKILNSDTVGHNTNIAPRKGANSFNQTIPAGGSVLHEPGGESPDPFPVTCSIHPWMKAYMITRSNPYFAVSKEDGSFSIPKVPAGVDLEFRVWQEKAGYLQEVTVNGKTEKWSKGRFQTKLEPGTPLRLDVVIDAAKFQ